MAPSMFFVRHQIVSQEHWTGFFANLMGQLKGVSQGKAIWDLPLMGGHTCALTLMMTPTESACLWEAAEGTTIEEFQAFIDGFTGPSSRNVAYPVNKSMSIGTSALNLENYSAEFIKAANPNFDIAVPGPVVGSRWLVHHRINDHDRWSNFFGSTIAKSVGMTGATEIFTLPAFEGHKCVLTLSLGDDDAVCIWQTDANVSETEMQAFVDRFTCGAATNSLLKIDTNRSMGLSSLNEIKYGSEWLKMANPPTSATWLVEHYVHNVAGWESVMASLIGSASGVGSVEDFYAIELMQGNKCSFTTTFSPEFVVCLWHTRGDMTQTEFQAFINGFCGGMAVNKVRKVETEFSFGLKAASDCQPFALGMLKASGSDVKVPEVSPTHKWYVRHEIADFTAWSRAMGNIFMGTDSAGMTTPDQLFSMPIFEGNKVLLTLDMGTDCVVCIWEMKDDLSQAQMQSYIDRFASGSSATNVCYKMSNEQSVGLSAMDTDAYALDWFAAVNPPSASYFLMMHKIHDSAAWSKFFGSLLEKTSALTKPLDCTSVFLGLKPTLTTTLGPEDVACVWEMPADFSLIGAKNHIDRFTGPIATNTVFKIDPNMSIGFSALNFHTYAVELYKMARPEAPLRIPPMSGRTKWFVHHQVNDKAGWDRFFADLLSQAKGLKTPAEIMSKTSFSGHNVLLTMSLGPNDTICIWEPKEEMSASAFQVFIDKFTRGTARNVCYKVDMAASMGMSALSPLCYGTEMLRFAGNTVDAPSRWLVKHDISDPNEWLHFNYSLAAQCQGLTDPEDAKSVPMFQGNKCLLTLGMGPNNAACVWEMRDVVSEEDVTKFIDGFTQKTAKNTALRIDPAKSFGTKTLNHTEYSAEMLKFVNSATQAEP